MRPCAAHVADRRVLLFHLLQPFAQLLAPSSGVAWQVLPLHDVEVRKRACRACRVTRIGEHVLEGLVGAAGEDIGHLGRCNRAAHREVTGGHSLGEAHDVRNDAHRIGPEPVAGSPESGYHFVENEQYPVLVADLPHPVPIPRAGDDAAQRLRYRLPDHRRDRVGVVKQNRFLDGVCAQLGALLGRTASKFAAVWVGIGHVYRVRRHGLVLLPRQERV